MIFLIQALPYLIHHGWQLDTGLRRTTTNIMLAYGGQAGPILYSTASVIGFCLFLYFRDFLTRPSSAWTILNLSFVFGGWSMTDPEFKQIIAKADNVPITMMIYTVGFFTWLAMRKAVINDKLIDEGRSTLNQPQRKRTYSQIQRVIHEEAPAIFLFTQYDTLGIAKRVEYAARGDEWLWLFDAKPRR